MARYRTEEWGQIVRLAGEWREIASRFYYDPELYPAKGLQYITSELMRLCDQQTHIDTGPLWEFAYRIDKWKGIEPMCGDETLDLLAMRCANIIDRLHDLGVVKPAPDQTPVNERGDKNGDKKRPPIRLLTDEARTCGKIFKEKIRKGVRTSLAAVIREYIAENGGSFHSIKRSLSEHPEAWKPRGSGDKTGDKAF